MYCPESDSIAARHPELAAQIRAIDRYLWDLAGQLFRLERTADLLGVDPGSLKRLLQLYETNGVVERVEVLLCPVNDEVLEPDEEGALWCDLCETVYSPDECVAETAYRARPRPAGAPAPSVPLFERGYGLFIGIGAYPHLRPLSKTILDAQGLYDLFTGRTRAGYPQGQVRLLLDGRATKAAINDALDWLARRVGPDDTVVFSFAGHGAQRVGGFEPGEYLCPVEADRDDLRSTAISTDELSTALGAVGARYVAVFLDACHAAGVGEPRSVRPAVRPGLSDEAYERLAHGRGRAIMASCRPDEVSWELPDMDHGLFTHYLLDGLQGAAGKADGSVRILDLFEHVAHNVPKHKAQHPVLKAELEENFYILPPDPTRS